MRLILSVAGLALSLCACDRVGASSWKAKYIRELELHAQTQAIKNAEIAARDLEVENQRQFIAILADRIEQLEKEKLEQLDKLQARKSERRGPLEPVTGKVTAVASEIRLVVLDVGIDQGLIVGDEFEITRNGEKIARARLDRVDKKWSAAKVVGNEGNPAKGDTATFVPK